MENPQVLLLNLHVTVSILPHLLNPEIWDQPHFYIELYWRVSVNPGTS